MKAKVFQDTFEDIVKKQCLLKKNPIIIVSGLSDYIDFFQYEDHIADIPTFDEEGNADYFDKTWFFNIFTVIGQSEDYIIVSHQQYAHIIENINSAYFSDRAILLYDNLRTLYPLYPDDYIEQKTEDGTEPRPEDMPVYQSEQFKIGDKFYYSLKRLDEGVVSLPFFTKERDLTAADFRYSNDAVVDISTNPYAIDYFINECLEHNDFSRKFIVKTFPKQPLSKNIDKELRIANYMLSLYGGGIFSEQEKSISREYKPSEDALRLLHTYWGEKAEFRYINVYDNPDYGNKVSPLSQGVIVDTI